ncbi:hypothetical protein Acr_02g0011830 [Actinidia rufa]|uniref:Sequence-specific DNA binding transcription factor n=1 Tax=Actinidia rufa TaxID=165716 RepID=A0A7J0E8Y3_9ERIC|nr:hypothetical protein Acr_02g0011830 [Actinidia rufa]
MSSRRNNPTTRTMRTRRRLKRICRAEKNPRAAVNGGACASLSDKLEALKSLIPAPDGERKPEELFQETADYIVLLKTQVLILQRLVDFYGSNQNQNQNQNQNAV